MFKSWGCLGCTIEGLGLKWFRGFKSLMEFTGLRGYRFTARRCVQQFNLG